MCICVVTSPKVVGGQGKYSSDILVTVTIAGVIVLSFPNVKMALLVSGHKGKSFSQLFLQQNYSNKYRFKGKKIG